MLRDGWRDIDKLALSAAPRCHDEARVAGDEVLEER